ncbi:hypothetical protein HYH03_018513 [Edaphochlamys debaryana]|uniref:Cytochrome b5 heme-binding domain-containing protein n=1 Tax=Edaphochlamys debaryana TaxID=47281 RepID=A0A835XLS5_9CHLO|nr:hypothetical protein HYH03_018513 [Edaphochlamys debaryana]|eukprot:KAG2482554.1 hypothetical protein HYH03_018513 [Edaphochlamys debaryana]
MDATQFFVALSVFFAVLIFILRRTRPPPPPPPTKYQLGDVTLESLRFYSGHDWSKPPLVAIRGKVYDVSNKWDDFGPGKPRNALCGREVARALALDSSDDKHFTDDVAGLGEEQLARLEAAEAEFKRLHDEVGQVVPMRELSPAELALHDGSDPAQPLLLAIRGVVYDITKGKDYYGPDGIYPFAGKEVARAFALFSTDLADCNDNLEGLSYTEQEALRDWTARFNSKYPIVGRLVGKA